MAKKSQKVTATEDGFTVETTITLIQSSIHYQGVQQVTVKGKKMKPINISGNIPPLAFQIANDQELSDALDAIPKSGELLAVITEHIEKERYEE